MVPAVRAKPKSRILSVQSDFTTILLGFRSCKMTMCIIWEGFVLILKVYKKRTIILFENQDLFFFSNPSFPFFPFPFFLNDISYSRCVRNDDCGITCHCKVQHKKRIKRKKNPWQLSIPLALSQNALYFFQKIYSYMYILKIIILGTLTPMATPKVCSYGVEQKQPFRTFTRPMTLYRKKRPSPYG